MILRLCAALAALLMAWSASAEECSKITDKEARLACFDRGSSGAPAAPAAGAGPKQEATSKRCQGTTRKGAQCKRNAQPGRSYCYQH